MKTIILEGTPGEIADLLERMPQLGSAPGRNGTMPGGSAGTTGPAFSVWSREKVAKMWNRLYGDQRKLVVFIQSKGGKVTVKDAQKHLHFGRGPQIAGVMSSITRNARRITKYKDARFVEGWVDENTRTRGYCIPEPLLSLLREAMAATPKKS